MRLCCDDICFLTQASTGRNQLQNHHNLASSGLSGDEVSLATVECSNHFEHTQQFLSNTKLALVIPGGLDDIKTEVVLQYKEHILKRNRCFDVNKT